MQVYSPIPVRNRWWEGFC